MVTAEPPDISVRNDDQRELCPGDGTILHTDKTIVDADPKVAELRIFRFGLAWIPDRARQVRAMVEKLDASGFRRKKPSKEAQQLETETPCASKPPKR